MSLRHVAAFLDREDPTNHPVNAVVDWLQDFETPAARWLDNASARLADMEPERKSHD